MYEIEENAIRCLLLACAVSLMACLSGCSERVGAMTTRYIRGAVRSRAGQPVHGWIGITIEDAEPTETYVDIPVREQWGEPYETRLGLVYTREDGGFSYEQMAGRYDYTLLMGIIPLDDVTAPAVPPVDTLFVHVHDGSGWVTTKVTVPPEAQEFPEPGEGRVELGTMIVERPE